MPTISIQTFGGEVPLRTARLLEQNQAAVAVNCDLRRGALEALRGPKLVQAMPPGAASIFKHDLDGWIKWSKGGVNVIKSAILDTEEGSLGHLFVCGDKPYPTQYLAGGATCRLGLPRPGAAPLVTVLKQEAIINTTVVYGFGGESVADLPPRYGIDQLPNVEGDGIRLIATAEVDDTEPTDPEDMTIQRSSIYCYTYVRSLADGRIQQESAPSPPSELVDVEDGDGVTVHGFSLPDMEDAKITHLRLYRTVSGEKSSEFRFLVELPLDTVEHIDTLHDKDVPTEVMRTSLWDSIPDDAHGLIKTDNGLYAAFHNNELLISEPFVGYAFPSAYRLTVEDSIVALGHVDGTIIVLTTGRPYLVAGSVPESLQLIHLPIEQACVSAASVASLPGGIVYASPDGLMLFTTGEQTLASAQTFTREQWQDLRPESIMGTVHDGRYIAFFAETNQGFIFSVGAKDIVRIELAKGWKVRCLYHHSEDDAVYIGADTPEGSGIWKLEAGDSLSYRWRSKAFFTSALVSMSAVRIEGEQQGAKALSVSVFGPKSDRPRARLRVSDARARRIRVTRAEKEWAVEVRGAVPVYELRLGTSIEGVEYGQ